MKLRAIQFSPILGDISKNLDFHLERIAEAIEDGVELIIFPELSLSGYHLKDIVYEVSLNSDSKEVRELKKISQNIDVIVGAPYEEIPGIIYNSAIYFSGGKIVHIHRKVQLPNFGMFQEEMIFKPGREFKIFSIKGFNVGILICREILFPINAYLYYLQYSDFLIGISNSPHRALKEDGFASLKLWETLGYVYSVFYHQNYLFVNRCGYEDGVGFAGGSFLARPGMGIVEKLVYFDSGILNIEINNEEVRRARFSGNYLRDEKPEVVFNELKRILNAKD